MKEEEERQRQQEEEEERAREERIRQMEEQKAEEERRKQEKKERAKKYKEELKVERIFVRKMLMFRGRPFNMFLRFLYVFPGSIYLCRLPLPNYFNYKSSLDL